MATGHATSARTSVYLYFDAIGVLIYVGITNQGRERQTQHVRSKEWWPYVHHQDVEHYDDRGAALDRERELIRAFAPPFNYQHNPDRSTRAAYEVLRTVGTDGPADSVGQRIPLVVVGRSAGRVILVSDFTYASVASRVTAVNGSPRLKAGDFNLKLHPTPRKEAPNV